MTYQDNTVQFNEEYDYIVGLIHNWIELAITTLVGVMQIHLYACNQIVVIAIIPQKNWYIMTKNKKHSRPQIRYLNSKIHLQT